MDIFSSNTFETIAELGEIKLIELIKDWLGSVSRSAPLGIGDDCAVFEPQNKMPVIVTTDALVYGRHFDKSLPPSDAGQKLVKRNLSDIAAMGGTPDFAVVALMLSRGIRTVWLEHFYRGIQASSLDYQTAIVGGDICQVDPPFFAATMTVYGHAPRPLTRQGAQAGDAIFVTGCLGGSILGKHWNFQPRLAEGRWLAQRPAVHALMDLSDGLAKDLPALLPVDCNAALVPQRIPISDAAHQISQTSHTPALQHAFNDGEDYELLFTVAHDTDTAEFKQQWHHDMDTPIECIGHVVKAEGAQAQQIINVDDGKPFQNARGFVHLQL